MRLNYCEECERYDWACKHAMATATDGGRVPARGNPVRDTQGLAACLLLGIVRLYYIFCNAVMRNIT
jgi:hypothetical protein